MSKDTNKPKEILELEFAYNIELSETQAQESDEHLTDLIQNHFVKNRNGEVEAMNLSSNQISDLRPVTKLKELRILHLDDNRISDLGPLSKLAKLSRLYLDRNDINDLDPLSKLLELERLFLNSNRISDLGPLSKLSKLRILHLADNRISDLGPLSKLLELMALDLESNQINYIGPLSKLLELKILDLDFNRISDLGPLSKLVKLSILNLDSNRISDLGPLSKLFYLEHLVLINNQITDLSQLSELSELRVLYLDSNRISELRPLSKLFELTNLKLGDNQITNLDPLSKLFRLEYLLLIKNQIADLGPLKSIVNSDSIRFIAIGYNPSLSELKLYFENNDNHLDVLRNYFKKRLDRIAGEIVTIRLPLKIMLLGNHGAGKSTFFDFFANDNNNIKNEGESTHVLRVMPYSETKEVHLPDAMVYDFGGQDYYHGVYQAFMSINAHTLLFWQQNTNHNKFTEDTNGYSIIHYNVRYWLGLHTFYQEKIRSASEILDQDQDPLWLIQTYADENEKDFTFYKELKERFFISLKEGYKKPINKLSLRFLKESLKAKIREREEVQKTKNSIALLRHITNNYQNDNHVSTDIKELAELYLGSYKKDDDLSALRGELYELAQSGLIIYSNQEMLKDKVWLNPTALARHVHERVLMRDVVNNGMVEKKEFEDIVGDTDLLALLKIQQVVFYDESTEKYIIPNYLPLLEDEGDDYFLFLSQHKPDIVLKYEEFIPFGYINRLICHFGKNPDKKTYRRNHLVFTVEEKATVMIQLDFEALKISLSVQPRTDQALPTYFLRGIFYQLVALYRESSLTPNYFDVKVKTRRNNSKINNDDGGKHKVEVYSRYNYDREKSFFSIPNDLYISMNNKDFVHLKTLENRKTTHTIQSYRLMDNQINKTKPFAVSTRVFKNISFNPNIKNMKKIFISYSKKDLRMVNTFQDHLSSLRRDNLVSTWYCTELKPGEVWDETIQKHFDESDIICFMVTRNFLKTDYIYEFELKQAITRHKKDKAFKIVPIILDFCEWPTRNPENNLAQFSALPYTAKPIASFRNQNLAWNMVVVCLSHIIKQNEFPDIKNFAEDNEFYKDNRLRPYFERLVEGRLDDNSI